MASPPQPLEYAAYKKLPEMKRRYDIVDGVLKFMSPAPDWFHQQVLFRIAMALHRHVERFRLGEVCPSPADVIISKVPLRTRQPDVMFVSNERRHLMRGALHGGPDLAIEILSPGNTPKDVNSKLRDYASVEVREVWLLDPARKTITVLAPDREEFRAVATYGVRQRLRSLILPRRSLAVRSVFP